MSMETRMNLSKVSQEFSFCARAVLGKIALFRQNTVFVVGSIVCLHRSFQLESPPSRDKHYESNWDDDMTEEHQTGYTLQFYLMKNTWLLKWSLNSIFLIADLSEPWSNISKTATYCYSEASIHFSEGGGGKSKENFKFFDAPWARSAPQNWIFMLNLIIL